MDEWGRRDKTLLVLERHGGRPVLESCHDLCRPVEPGPVERRTHLRPAVLIVAGIAALVVSAPGAFAYVPRWQVMQNLPNSEFAAIV